MVLNFLVANLSPCRHTLMLLQDVSKIPRMRSLSKTLFAFFPMVMLMVKGFEHSALKRLLKQPRLLCHCLDLEGGILGASPCLVASVLPLPGPCCLNTLKSGSRSSLNICPLALVFTLL